MARELDITLRGGPEARRRFRALQLALTDLRPFWPLVVPVVTGWWRRQFQTEGAYAGIPWPALAAKTLARKLAGGGRSQILQDTGQLLRAASNPRRHATPSMLTLTIDDSGPAHGPVLQYHQTGDGVPKRPVVFGDPLPPLARAELNAAADVYVRGLLSRLG